MLNGNVFTVKHWIAIFAMIAILLTGFGVLSTKADKQELDKSEERLEKRITELRGDIKGLGTKLDNFLMEMRGVR